MTAALTDPEIDHLERAIGDLPGLVADLEMTVTRQSAGGHSRAAADHVERPLPFRTGPRIDTARQAVDGLAEWCELIAGARPIGRDLPHRAFAASAALLSRLSWFREDDRAADAAAKILQIRAALRRAVDRPPSRTVWAGPCLAEVTTLEVDVDATGHKLTPRAVTRTCEGDVLAEPGDPLALCRECRVHHPITERHAWMLAGVDGELLPLPEILAVLPALIGRRPDPATVRQWRARGRLEPVTVTTSGVPLYRGGDVIRLAQDTDTRPGPRRRDKKGIPA